MPARDVVVLGASSGGLEAVSKLIAGLPDDFAAAVFVVIHVGERARGDLPAILNRVGRLPAAHAVADEPIRRGRIYVAPPGLQTYLQPGRLSVRRGPQENRHRPSIDALFRTAAHHYGDRVVGVVLSGALDDGSAGLVAIKRAGGITIVQDPNDARVPDMPLNALERAHADYSLPADEIGPLLVSLVGIADSNTEEKDVQNTESITKEVPLETVEEASTRNDYLRSDQLGPPSVYTCPECSGTLFEVEDEHLVRYRCRVGHGFTLESFASAQNDSVERALWVALRALEERSALMIRIAEDARRRGHEEIAETFESKSKDVEHDVRLLHRLITNGHGLELPVEDVEPRPG
jgi:two-component system, chemotaxis family, protein-glutamate methylesterase/glutaminase